MKKIANNHKTTITGVILAILIAVQPLTTQEGFDIQKDWIQVVIAAGIAFFGWLSQDAQNNQKPKQDDTYDQQN